MTLVVPAFAGLLAGLIHTLTGPDHLAAVGPLAAHRSERHWLPGLQWGTGHTLGMLILAAATLWLKQFISPETTSAYAEDLVGFMLIAIGAGGLRRLAASPDQPSAPHHRHAALGVGTLHGVAGGAHFFGLLPALALPTTGGAILYLLFFGAGTMGAMAGFSTVVGLLAKNPLAERKIWRPGYTAMMRLCSWSAILVGLFWLAPR